MTWFVLFHAEEQSLYHIAMGYLPSARGDYFYHWADTVCAVESLTIIPPVKAGHNCHFSYFEGFCFCIAVNAENLAPISLLFCSTLSGHWKKICILQYRLSSIWFSRDKHATRTGFLYKMPQLCCRRGILLLCHHCLTV